MKSKSVPHGTKILVVLYHAALVFITVTKLAARWVMVEPSNVGVV